jgi:hypothetical protein
MLCAWMTTTVNGHITAGVAKKDWENLYKVGNNRN